MSEHDIALGGVAATKFASKQLNHSISSSNNQNRSQGSSLPPHSSPNTGRVEQDNNSNETTTQMATTMKNAYQSSTSNGTYQNSDQVRQHYLQLIEQQEKQQQPSKPQPTTTTTAQTVSTSTTTNSLPFGWEDRQKSKELQAKQHGVFNTKRKYNVARAFNLPRTRFFFWHLRRNLSCWQFSISFGVCMYLIIGVEQFNINSNSSSILSRTIIHRRFHPIIHQTGQGTKQLHPRA